MIGKLASKVRWVGGEQLSQAVRRLRQDWPFTAAFIVTRALASWVPARGARKLDVLTRIRPE